ncbi:hypothetical protein [Actinomadura sp. 6N118]|uniref:hypothetical protein n=1 Tax=Actinomadura sp. 6N118 TaxID=3375151 RepID=UPI0037952377
MEATLSDQLPAVRWVGEGGILAYVIIADVVLETYFDAAQFTGWPIAQPSSDHILVLSGQMSRAEVGTAMAVLFDYTGVPAEPLAELHHLMDRHLVEAETLGLPGGLRLRDTVTRAQIVPGCCCGVEEWRDWREILYGDDEIWLGHGLGTTVQIENGVVRLHQIPLPEYPLHTLEIELGELAVLLASVHRRLQGFLGLVGEWAGQVSPEAADRLVEILDENLQITDPLLLG